MKTILLIIGCLFLFTHGLLAQIIDRSHNLGFFTKPFSVQPLRNGNWLATGKGEVKFPDDPRESVFFLIFTQNQQLLTQSHVSYEYGGYAITDAVVLPDSGFILAYNYGDCDAGGHDRFLEKRDAAGAWVWQLKGRFEDGLARPPEQWRLAPDGNLIGFDYDRIWKVNAATGQVLWKGQVAGLDLQTETIYNFELLPGTEDLFTLQSSGFYTWEKGAGAVDHDYFAQKSLSLDGRQRQGVGWAGNGWYYTLNTLTGQLERINANLDLETLNAGNLEGLGSMSSSSDGLYLLGRLYDQNWLRKTDFLGQHPVELPMPDRWLIGCSVAARGDSVMVLGVDGSGPKSQLLNSIYNGFQAQQLWVRSFRGANPQPSPDTMDVAVTAVRQRSVIDTASYPGNGGFQYFKLQGGNFQIQLSNLGNTVLHQVYVNFSYKEDQTPICYYTPTKQVYYDALSLQPDDSVWVDFGDLSIKNQSGLANYLCFWTVGPNFQPDVWHENDFYCHLAEYKGTPTTAAITLLPNPAPTCFRVTNFHYPEQTAWRLYDAMGRLIKTGLYTPGLSDIEVSTAVLPNGFYFFRIKDYIGKVVVKH